MTSAQSTSMRPMPMFQITHIAYAYGGHRLYNSEGILKLQSNFCFEY